MSDLLRVVLATWCWLVAHCTLAARTPRFKMQLDNSDLNLTTPQLVRKYGYPVEIHRVLSQGYILELHRIPHGREASGEAVRPAVLVHHALMCSSFDWVVMGPDRSLGLILADTGYDVWLANARGNTYSRKHETLQPSDPEFWEFSWGEMGEHDVPAEIDYIQGVTGETQLFYIGHSMGTAMFFAMMSQRPEYNHKIRAMVAFAPIAYFSPTKNPVFFFIQRVAEALLERMLNFVGMYEFLPSTTILNPISYYACKDGVFTQRFCLDFMFFIVGKSSQLDKKRLTVMLAHTPAGASSRQLMHFAQMALSGEFWQFDFGEDKNIEVYGQPTPPRYHLDRVTAPVAVYYSDNDKLSRPYNLEKIVQELPNVIGKFRVPMKTFNHLDFMWGRDANFLLYKDVIKHLRRFESDETT